MMNKILDLNECSILVTGGQGFLGRELVRQLKNRGCRFIFAPSHSSYDLTKAEDVKNVIRDSHPDVVFHLASRGGGIAANRANPGLFFYENAIMGIQLMEEARRFGVKRFIYPCTVCSYPKKTTMPLIEDNLFSGPPEETNESYACVKRMLIVQAKGYRVQYGFHALCFFVSNVYGPEDNFDPLNSHVIPAMIQKLMHAKMNGMSSAVFWGDGSPTREFVYRDDAIRAIITATEYYDHPFPLNIASGFEISMKDLASLIQKIVGYSGQIVWDTSKPNGQMRRALDVTRSKQFFSFHNQILIEEGLRRTIAWYKSYCEQESLLFK